MQPSSFVSVHCDHEKTSDFYPLWSSIMIIDAMLGQQSAASALLSTSLSRSKLYSDHQYRLQLPAERRSVLDSWSPSPTSSAITPSFRQSSCESGGSDGAPRGAVAEDQQHHPHHEEYPEPSAQIEEQIQVDEIAFGGVELSATEDPLDEVPLIDCSSLLAWGEHEELELGKFPEYLQGDGAAETLAMVKCPKAEESGIFVGEGGSMLLNSNALASESVLEMFGGASEPTLDEMLRCLGSGASKMHTASYGYGELSTEQILGQVCEPNQGQEVLNVLVPACDATLLPPSSLFHQDQQAPQSYPQEGLLLSTALPFSHTKRPRFSSFPPVLYSHPQPQPQEAPYEPFLHKKQPTAHPFPFHHHLSSSSPWPASNNLRPSVLNPAPPMHCPDFDHLPSHVHPRLFGKSIPFAYLLHLGSQLTMAVEAAEIGNTHLTQAILARLNSSCSLSPHPTAPLLRAVSLFEKAIAQQSGLVQLPNPTLYTLTKISAYRSFCAISPLPQFSHFVANQSALEVIEGQERIHIVDFELGLGERWASLMQELSQKAKGTIQLRITAVTVGSCGDGGLTCQLARESLLEFAKGLNMIFCFEAVPLAKLNSLIGLSKEAFLINLGSDGLSQLVADLGSPEPVLSLLYFIKSLSPKVITMIDRECYAVGGSGSSFLTQALKLCACFIETIDSSGMDADVMTGIEQYVLAPQIHNAVKIRRIRQNMPPWKTLLQRAGFSLKGCSAATEAQAGCLIKGPNSGYSVAKQQSTLVLAWHSINLLQASSWGP